jgi:hypothetical protein
MKSSLSESFDFDEKLLEGVEIDGFLQKTFEVKEMENLIKRIVGK